MKSIKDILSEFEKLLYGYNYECHFRFEHIAESTDIIKVRDKINSTFNLEDWQKTQELIPISYNDFKTDVTEKLSYRGDNAAGHGLDFSEPQEKQFFENLTNLWSEIEKIVDPNSADIYIHVEIYTWIFWGFCFLIICKDTNQTYLFEGISSD